MMFLMIVSTLLLGVGVWWALGPSGIATDANNAAKVVRVLVIYAVLLCTALIGLGVGPHLGFGDNGGPNLSDSQRRRLVHHGYYTSLHRPLTFAGERSDSTVFHAALDGDDNGTEVQYIRLTPEVVTGPQVKTWHLESNGYLKPLRVDGVVSNLPPEAWISPGEIVRIERRLSGERLDFLEFEWVAGLTLRTFFRERRCLGNCFYFSSGTREGSVEQYNHSRLELTRRVYRVNRGFDDMLRLAPAEFRTAVNVDSVLGVWGEVLTDLTWVREVRGDVSSRMGVMVERLPDGASDANVRIVLGTRDLLRLERPPFRARLAPGARISFGFDHRNALELDSLPRTPLPFRDGLLGPFVHAVRFAGPVVWPLPPKPEEPFLLTSANTYIPLDGYTFSGLSQSHTFYAKGQVNPTADSLTVNSGRAVFRRPLNAPTFLGSRQSGVHLSLSDVGLPRPFGRALPLPIGWQAVLVLTLLTSLFAWVERSRLPRRRGSLPLTLSRVWAVLWGSTLTLLTLRLLIAYRVAFLTPEDATPNEVNVFIGSYLLGFWALVGVPAAMLFARWLGGKSSWWQRLRDRWMSPAGRGTGLGNGRPWSWVASVIPVSLSIPSVRRRFIQLAEPPLPPPDPGRRTRWSAAGSTGLIALLIPIVWLLVDGLFGPDEPVFGALWSLVRFFLFVLLAGGGVWLALSHVRMVLSGRTAVWQRYQARWIKGTFIGALPFVVPPLLVVALGMMTGSADKWLIGGRTSHLAHGVLVLCLALAGRALVALRNSAAVLGTALLVVLTVVIVLVDNGFVIYTISFACCWCCMAAYSRRPKSVRGRLLAWSPAMLGTLFVLGMGILSNPETTRNLPLARDGQLFNRLVTVADSETDVLLARSERVGLDMNQLLRSVHQHWQMTLYSRKGIADAPGYGQVPLTDIGLTYPTSLSDCVFAIYLLGENGPGVAWLVLLLLLSLFAVLWVGGAHLPARINESRVVVLVLIGSFFVANALYMVFANLGMVVFTGQNIPLFALNSPSDFGQGGLLLSIAVLLVTLDVRTDGRNRWRRADTATIRRRFHVRVGGYWLAAYGFVVLFIGLLFLYRNVFGWSETRPDDYNLDRAVYEKITERRWRYEQGALIPEDLTPLHEIERLFKAQFEARSAKADPSAGLYYLASSPSRAGQRVDINEQYFLLDSPFDEAQEWGGTILARGSESTPVIATMGIECRIRLGSGAEYAGLRVRADGCGSQEAPGRVILRDDSGARALDLRDTGEGVKAVVVGGGGVYHEGKELNVDTTLVPLDLVVIDRGQQQVLIYLGRQGPILATSLWRNGRRRHQYPEGGAFASVHTLVRAMETATRDRNAGEARTDRIQLSIDARLQRELQSEINAFALTYSPFRTNPDPASGNIIALTVLESHTGQVRALPAWPIPDLEGTGVESTIRRAAGETQRRYLVNHNYRRHVVGSTIKPLLLSSVAHGYGTKTRFWQADFFVRGTQEPDGTCTHEEVAGLPLSPAWNSRWPCNTWISWRTFIPQSRNYYAVMLGALGLALEPSDSSLVMTRASRGAANMRLPRAGGYDYYRLEASRHPSLFTTNNPPDLTGNISQTFLFGGLEALFPAQIWNGTRDFRLEQRDLVQQTARTFLPGDLGRFVAGTYLVEEIALEPLFLNPNRDWRGAGIRQDLVSFLLGGGTNRWSNVDMAAAGARLATGLRVVPTLDDKAPEATEQLPAPLDDLRWRNRYVIDAMERSGMVWQESDSISRVGTAFGIRTEVQRLNPLSRQYRFLFKTGTLADGPDQPDSELLLFTVGAWGNELADGVGAFIPGHTVSGYLYIQRASGRAILAPKLLDVLVDYLERTRLTRSETV